MGISDELSLLNAEWRDEVRQRLNSLSELIKDLGQDQIQPLERRTRSLETAQAKVIGALAVIQAVGAAAIWILNKVTSGH